MNDSDRTLAVVRDVFAAFDAHDLDRFRGMLADDAVLRVAGGSMVFSGPEAISAAVGATMEAIPDLRVSVTNAFASGAHGVAEVVREGTNTGPVRLPAGESPPTGLPVRLPECVVFEVRDGKIVLMVPYADQLDAMSQLGLLPARS
jgi:ketosteroid isomerase-like protein